MRDCGSTRDPGEGESLVDRTEPANQGVGRRHGHDRIIDLELDRPGSQLCSTANRNFRYMFEKVSTRSNALDQRVETFESIVRTCYEIDDLWLGAKGPVTLVGRVIIENGFGSAVLEMSRQSGSGLRAPLRFPPNFKAGVGSGPFTIFPGAILALKGTYSEDRSILVDEVLPLPVSKPLLPFPDLPLDRHFSVAMAAGPFTHDGDLEYAPFKRLMESLIRAAPSVVVLFGPFIDQDHGSIKRGDTDLTPDAMFTLRILTPLRNLLLGSPEIRVVLVPSIRDLISKHAVFPQAELDARFSGGDKRIRLFPNPASFSVNGITFGASNVDVLLHLRETLCRMSVYDASLENYILCRHLLEQRSFYPLFPAWGDRVNLDVSHSSPGLDLGGNAPHVMLLPSVTDPFYQRVEETLFINPSGVGGQAFALLSFRGGVEVEMRSILS